MKPRTPGRCFAQFVTRRPGRHHQVAVLKDLAELAGGLHAADLVEGRGGRRGAIGEQPFQVLTPHAGAGADQMADLHALGDVRVGEFDAGVGVGSGLVPAQLAGVDRARQHGRRHRLGAGRSHEQGVGIHLGGLALLAHAQTSGPDGLVAADEAQAHAGHIGVLHAVRDESLELLDLLRRQRLGGLAGEALALVALRPQRRKELADGSAALFQRGFGGLKQQHDPGLAVAHAAAPCDGLHDQLLVGRRLVLEDLLVNPAAATGPRHSQAQRAFELGLREPPDLGHHIVGMRGRGQVDHNDARITLGRDQPKQRTGCADREGIGRLLDMKPVSWRQGTGSPSQAARRRP